MTRLLRVLLACATLLAAGPALAHRTSDAFLSLDVSGSTVAGHWAIALRDLELLANLDRDGDRILKWGELRIAQDRLAELLLGQLTIADDRGTPCELQVDDLLIEDRVEGPFGHFVLRGSCAAAPQRELVVGYRLLLGIDPSHRGLLTLMAGGVTQNAVLPPSAAQVRISLGDRDALRVLRDFVLEGVRHIWIGLDHVLFLVCLLLPCVLVRQEGRWRGAPSLRAALWQVVGVVTAFTLAHSITLGLAALDVLRLPVRLTESAIAATVLLAALNNVRPVVTGRRWAMALGFGLIHGFGFASVLGELGLPAGARALALVAFNLGVELGQLAIVIVAVPLAFAVRDTKVYQRGLVVGGSLLAAALAAFWLFERVTGA